MEVSPVSALLATRFPPRSSSYRAFSIIDAYGGDPGIQFSPVEEELPAKNPVTTSMSDVKKLQGEDQLSSYYNLDVDETYGSSYGSDPERSTMAILNDYDPFRQGAPVHTPISKVVTPVQKVETPGEKIERSRADSGLAGGMSLFIFIRALTSINLSNCFEARVHSVFELHCERFGRCYELKTRPTNFLHTRDGEEAREKPTIETK